MKNVLLFLTLLGAASFTRALGAQQPLDSQGRDVELTRKIRKELTKDNSLSMTAKNVKVITHEGEVILRGPVKNEQEENKVVATAKNIAGEESVQNQLEVKMR